MNKVLRAWFDKFRHTLVLASFSQSQYDPSLFLFKTSHAITILPVYADDIIITRDDPKAKPHLTIIAFSHASFHMEDLGPLTYSVLKFTEPKVDYLSINTSMLKISLPTTLVDTLLELNVKYKKDDGILSQVLYSIGILLAVWHTCLLPAQTFLMWSIFKPDYDSAYSTSLVCCQEDHSISYGYFKARHVFPNNSNLNLNAYCDADWAGSTDIVNPPTGWCVYLGNTLIS